MTELEKLDEALQFQKRYAKLEKENTELKEKCETLEDMLDEGISYQKAKNYDGLVTSIKEATIEIREAKRIIKDLLSYSVTLDSCLCTIDYEASRQKAIDYINGKPLFMLGC